MTAADLKTIRGSLGLGTAAFGRGIGVNARTVCRWEEGRYKVPEPVVFLLMEVKVSADAHARFMERAGLSRKRRR